MSDPKWAPRPHGDWETLSSLPWGGVYFAEELPTFEYSESQAGSESQSCSESLAGSEVDRENLLEVKFPRMYTAIASTMLKPQVLGSYASDMMGDPVFGNPMPPALDRHFLPQTGKMRVRLDLNKGNENYSACSGGNRGRFYDLLRWILENRQSLTSTNRDPKRLSVDFISDLGNITRAMRTPYNVTEAWTMAAVEYKGTIYLTNWSPPNKNASSKGSTPSKDPRKPLQQRNDLFLLNGRNSAEVSGTPATVRRNLLHPVNDWFPKFERHSENTIGSSTVQRNTFGSSTVQTNTYGSSTVQRNTFGSSTVQRNTHGSSTVQRNTFGSSTVQRNTFESPTVQRNTLHSSDVGGYLSSPMKNGPLSISPKSDSSKTVSPRSSSSKEPSLEEANMWMHTFRHILRGGDPENGVDANIEYHCVLKTAFGANTLLYSPNVDCVDLCGFKTNFKNLDAFVSVKCCPQLSDKQRIKAYKKFKLSQWWSENQLLGVPRMLVGFRSDEGVVHTLELLTTKNILREAEGEWDPNVCLTFLEEFLEFVKAMVKKYSGRILRFEYEARGDIKCRKLRGHNPLPKWYRCQLFPEPSAPAVG